MAAAPTTTSRMMNWILPLRRAADWPRVASLSRADLSCSNDADSVALPAVRAANTESGIVIDSDLKLGAASYHAASSARRYGRRKPRCWSQAQVRQQETAILVTGADGAAAPRGPKPRGRG